MKNGDIFVSTKRSARNMAFQEMTPDFGKVQVEVEMVGQDIMGVKLSAPMAAYEVSCWFLMVFSSLKI